MFRYMKRYIALNLCCVYVSFAFKILIKDRCKGQLNLMGFQIVPQASDPGSANTYYSVILHLNLNGYW